MRMQMEQKLELMRQQKEEQLKVVAAFGACRTKNKTMN